MLAETHLQPRSRRVAAAGKWPVVWDADCGGQLSLSTGDTHFSHHTWWLSFSDFFTITSVLEGENYERPQTIYGKHFARKNLPLTELSI